ncbi:MAG: hypothetical protein KAG98_01995, partial [Lentisphaeria bacterium]|nr:hypothetical protein [Lentisphaeria bacterium]
KKHNSKKMTYTEETGVAIVRAHQAPGSEPIYSNSPDLLIFDYKVPYNKKVTLKFVGERRSTSLYVDGKLIGTKNKQTVCPLSNLGSTAMPESFQGILHHAKISSVAILPPPPAFAGNWTPKHLKADWTNLTMDVSKKLTKAGDKSIVLQYTNGACRLDINQVELLVDGKVVSIDKHHGFTGGSTSKNIYKVNLKKFSAKSKYELRLLVKADGGTDSYGKITIAE